LTPLFYENIDNGGGLFSQQALPVEQKTSDNCKQIHDSKGLFFKIILTAKNEVYEIPQR
jgi:hypothetical protein